MASTNRTVPNESQQSATSGNSRPGRRSGEGAEGWLRERVTGVLNARKSRVSDQLEAVADTVRRVGEPLHGEPYDKLGGYADGAARTIERVATGLRDRDLDELAEDVRGFARRQPAVFIGAGLAAGVVAARFLKSSSDHGNGVRGTQGQGQQRGRPARGAGAADAGQASGAAATGARGRGRGGRT